MNDDRIVQPLEDIRNSQRDLFLLILAHDRRRCA